MDHECSSLPGLTNWNCTRGVDNSPNRILRAWTESFDILHFWHTNIKILYVSFVFFLSRLHGIKRGAEELRANENLKEQSLKNEPADGWPVCAGESRVISVNSQSADLQTSQPGGSWPFPRDRHGDSVLKQQSGLCTENLKIVLFSAYCIFKVWKTQHCRRCNVNTRHERQNCMHA